MAAIFTPELRRTTIVTTLMFACAYGAAFGAIQQMPRIVPGLPEVRTLAPPQQQQTAAAVQAFQEVGGLVGRFALAFLALHIVLPSPIHILNLIGTVAALVYLADVRPTLQSMHQR